jgi:hypothetical protein
MSLPAFIQILKVNDLRKGVGQKSGKPYEMQDAECMLLNESGELEQVGVLQLPKDMTGDAAPRPGVYIPTYGMRAGMQDRKIAPVILSLTPHPHGKVAQSSKSASAAAA